MRIAALLMGLSGAVASFHALGASDGLSGPPPGYFQYLPPVKPVETIFRPGESVLIIGDSLVLGKGVSKERSFPVLFDKLTVARVVGEGKSGETSTALLKRLPGAIRKQPYRWVVLVTGGNDILRNQADGTLKANLIQMVREIRAAQAHPVLIAIPDPRTMVDIPAYREVASAMQVPLLENLGKVLDRRHLQPDGVHPNAEGYKVIAYELMKFFAKDTPRSIENPNERPTAETDAERKPVVVEAEAPAEVQPQLN